MKDLNIEILEPFISYETALLAKEKGFDIETPKVYATTKQLEPYNEMRWILYRDYCFAPTQSLLQAWLRVVHNMNIVPVQVPDSENHIIYLNGREWTMWKGKPWISRICIAGYEQCLELGLQEALKSLK